MNKSLVKFFKEKDRLAVRVAESIDRAKAKCEVMGLSCLLAYGVGYWITSMS